jgi:hypothetical protein
MPTAMFRTMTGRQVWIGSGSLLSRAHFHHTGNKGLVVPSVPFTLRGTADERLIHFNRPFTANRITFWPNHCSTQFV